MAEKSCSLLEEQVIGIIRAEQGTRKNSVAFLQTADECYVNTKLQKVREMERNL